MSIAGIAPEESERLNGLWRVAERAGLLETPAAMEAAVKGYEEALGAERTAKQAVGEAQADHDAAVGLAEMGVNRLVVKEAAKTFLPDENSDSGRRQVSADEAKSWVAMQVAQDPDVIVAAKALAVAKLTADEARDRTAVADKRISQTKYSVMASVTLGRLLTTPFERNL